jgi:hypothetical protein
LSAEPKELSVTIPVVQFIDREIAHVQKTMDIQFDAHQRALELAMIRLNERLEEMNKFRAQLVTERGEYLSRERFDTEHSTLINRVSAIELQNSKWSGSIWMLGGAISAVVVGINILMKMWPK